MTPDERAEEVMSIFRCMLIETIDGRVLTGVDLVERIAGALRDQMEECAKVGDEQAAFHKTEADRLSKNEDAANCERTGEHASERIAAKIRALAGLV